MAARRVVIGLLVLILLGGIITFLVRLGGGLGNIPLPGTLVDRSARNRVIYVSNGAYLVVEVLDDDLIHFEAGGKGDPPPASKAITTTPMVLKTDYKGPEQLKNDGQGTLETAELRVKVDPTSLCATLTDLASSPEVELTRICPQDVKTRVPTLTMTSKGYGYAYGLGEQFVQTVKPSLNWAGKLRRGANDFGNGMDSIYGYVGNAQFPVLYALADDGRNFALFIDDTYALRWYLQRDPWTVETGADALRWYFFSGSSLPGLRQSYMELVGRPPVPPKKFLGLWVSEYGFDDWAELHDKLKTLRANHFPLDGLVLDLQWFGNIGTEVSKMGNVAWDTSKFPNPSGKIAELRRQGVGIMTIEEPYVFFKLPEFADLRTRGYLVRKCAGCEPTFIQTNWWGSGGMLDWTNPDGADYWHDLKRQPLVRDGVMGFWTDLGEPENFAPYNYYHGLPDQNRDGDAANGQGTGHGEAKWHNLYSFLWNESIVRGFRRHRVDERPFMMSRSGTTGIQRFGTAMWSGDISSSNLSLAAHLVVQGQMSFSGMDYFGSDIGGFHRQGAEGKALDDLYTRWFALGALTDIPVRPHTENLCNCKETAPDRVGNLQSNLANIRLRYMLSPYIYSLAYRAHLYGEPVVPPLVYYYQKDGNTRTIADQKMLGSNLLLAALPGEGQMSRDVYLPAGTWIDFYSNQWIDSQGQTITGVSAQRDGLFRLPLYARAGAILPLMYVDDATLDIMGTRSDGLGDGRRHSELIVRVYAIDNGSQTTLYEDDGLTTAYLKGQTRTTPIRQQISGDSAQVEVGPANGIYDGAPIERETVIQLVTRGRQAEAVRLGNQDLTELKSQAQFDEGREGWFNAGNGLILARAGRRAVGVSKNFVFYLK